MLSFDCQDISLCLVRIIVQTLYLEVSLLFDVNNFILKPTFVGFEDSHLRWKLPACVDVIQGSEDSHYDFVPVAFPSRSFYF